MNSQQFAHIHSLCIVIIIIFHICLMIGKPWGHLTMAGRFQGELPFKMKLFSGLSILILFFIATIVEIGSGNLLSVSRDLRYIMLSMALIFNVFQTILHTITPSKWERILWLPIILIMLCTNAMILFGHQF